MSGRKKSEDTGSARRFGQNDWPSATRAKFHARVFRHKRRNQVISIDTLQRITDSAWQPDEGLGFDVSPTPVETIEERILTKDAN